MAERLERDLVARGLTREEARAAARWLLAPALGGLIGWLHERRRAEPDRRG